MMGEELEHSYSVFVFEQINGANATTKRKWLNYDNILDELSNMGELKLIDEIKYRITDKESDKKVFKSVLKKIKNKSARLNLLINSI
tara:strand:+ start:1049 stop:1309 length:261 start_codon:yes stop_codon:yes gene_type:complete